MTGKLYELAFPFRMFAGHGDPTLSPGDIVLYRGGTSWLSRLIRWGTKSPYSHAIIYAGKKKDLFSLAPADMKEDILSCEGDFIFAESDFSVRRWVKSLFGLVPGYRDGTGFVGLDDLKKRNGSHDVFRSAKVSAVALDLFFPAFFSEMAKGQKYDFAGLLWQAVIAARLRFLRRGTDISLHNKREVYCSEFLRTVHYSAGLMRAGTDGLQPEETTPEIESKRPDVSFVGNF